MSTSTIRHGNKIYRYYRCRSMNAGQSLCRKTQISAGQIEKEVCQIHEIIHDPDSGQVTVNLDREALELSPLEGLRPR